MHALHESGVLAAFFAMLLSPCAVATRNMMQWDKWEAAYLALEGMVAGQMQGMNTVPGNLHIRPCVPAPLWREAEPEEIVIRPRPRAPKVVGVPVAA